MRMIRKLKNLFSQTNEPKIRLVEFAHTAQRYLADESLVATADEGQNLLSQLCRHSTLYSENFANWIDALGIEMRSHRKLWELGYILQALHENSMIGPGRRGLAFAVGQERVPSLLAARGCSILATDLADDDERNEAWAKTGQWSGSALDLHFPELCDQEIFRKRVRFRSVDMNRIPVDLQDFDFAWSTCSFEHCGSIELGIRFLENQMACLRPGGIAVHTTEFNLTSNDDTWTSGGTSIYRLCDIVEIADRLTSQGHKIRPLDLRTGAHQLDQFVDTPSEQPPYYTANRHLRLALGPFACTSIGLIIEKAS